LDQKGAGGERVHHFQGFLRASAGGGKKKEKRKGGKIQTRKASRAGKDGAQAHLASHLTGCKSDQGKKKGWEGMPELATTFETRGGEKAKKGKLVESYLYGRCAKRSSIAWLTEEGGETCLSPKPTTPKRRGGKKGFEKNLKRHPRSPVFGTRTARARYKGGKKGPTTSEKNNLASENGGDLVSRKRCETYDIWRKKKGTPRERPVAPSGRPWGTNGLLPSLSKNQSEKCPKRESNEGRGPGRRFPGLASKKENAGTSRNNTLPGRNIAKKKMRGML